MAITISGINNNDRIVATDGTIDALSGFNVVGVLTATSFSGNLTGNVTGNINNTTLLLQTSGTERIRITGNNEIGIAGANYGTAGQVLTSGGSGSAVSWTTINQGVTSDGSQNTVGGSNAGDSIISGGTENTVFGYNAGTAITNGDSNTFFGSRAGRSVSTGLSNTGVGYNVMGNASGTDNAALGMDAGNGMGDGRYHVAIGKGAFANTNQIGSQQNNIVIGYLADVSGNTVSNEMTLGNTNINHVRIPGIGVSFSEGGAVISGIVTATSYRGDGSQLTGISQVGGASTVSFNDNVPIYFGDNNDYKIYFNNSKMSFEPTHSGTQQFEMVSNNQMYIHAKASGLFLRASNQEVISIYGGSGGGVYFRHNGTQKLKLEGGNFTYENGATVTHASHVYIPDSIIHVGDTNTKIRFPADDTISFETAGSERLRIKSNGRVGVGSDDPQHTLDVFGNIRSHQQTPSLYLQTTANTAESAIIRFGDAGSFQRAAIQYDFAGDNHLIIKMGGLGNNVERMRIRGTDGAIKIGGHSANRDMGGLSYQKVHIEGTDGGSSAIGIFNNQNSTGSSGLYLGKSRGTSVGANTIVQDDDTLGSIVWVGADGNDAISQGAMIQAKVDGTPGSNDMPGRLVFSTTPEGGSSTVVRRMTIGQDGHVEFRQNGNCKTYFLSSGKSGSYSQLTIIIDAHAWHSFVITVAHGGYAGSWTTSKFMGYENGTMYYANEGTETTDSNSRNVTHSQNPGGGHKHRIEITGGMGTHPVCELRITIGGNDAYIDSGDITFTWS